MTYDTNTYLTRKSLIWLWMVDVYRIQRVTYNNM